MVFFRFTNLGSEQHHLLSIISLSNALLPENLLPEEREDFLNIAISFPLKGRLETSQT